MIPLPMNRSKQYLFRFVFVPFLISFIWTSSAFALAIDFLDSEGQPFYLEKEVAKNPDKYIDEMERALKVGNLDVIISIGRHAVDLPPGNGDIGALYAIGLASRGQGAQARETLNRAIETATVAPFYRYCAEAMILKADGNLDRALSAAKRANGIDVKHPYPYNIIGRLYIDLGQRQKAIEAFKQAIALEVNFIPAYANLGAALYLNQDYPAAIGYFSEGVRRSPGSFNIHFGLAVSMEAAGDFAGAISHYSKSLRLNPNSAESLSRLTSLQLKSGMFADALAGGKKMEQKKIHGAQTIIADASLHLGDDKTFETYIEKLDDQNPDKPFFKGYRLLLNDHYDQARMEMERVLQLNPNHFGAFYTRAVIAFCLDEPIALSDDQIDKWGGFPAKLLHALSATVAASKSDWQLAHDRLCQSEGLLGGFQMDGISVEDLVQGTTKDELKDLNLGILFYFRNFLSQSSAEFAEGIKKNPTSIFSNYFAGHVELKMGNRQEAAIRFEKATQKAPNFFSALYAAGEIRATQGDFDSAFGLYHRAQQTKEDPGLLIKVGLLYEMKGKFQDAEQMYLKVTRLMPDNFIGYNQLAWLYTKQGINLDEAIRLAKRADQLQPGNASIQDTLGWAYFKKNEPVRAKKYLEAATAANPNNPTILYHLGVVYHAIGETEAAKQALNRSLEKSKSFAEAEEAKKLLLKL